jgi:hypothetical protein
MRILFDQGTPVPLRRYLEGHQVDTAAERGWSDLGNGELLDQAEAEDYDVLVTTDRNIRYQQNLDNREIAILVLLTFRWDILEPHAELVLTTLETMPARGVSNCRFALVPPAPCSA